MHVGLNVGTGGTRRGGRTYADVGEVSSAARLCGEVTDPGRMRTREQPYGVYRSLYPATREAISRPAGLASAEGQG